MGAALIGREKLKLRLHASGRPVTIFCGHYHMIDEACDGTLQQHSSPAASYQIVKEAKGLEIDQTYFGYRIITITNNRVTTEVVTLKSH
jgi:Icc protein